MQATISKRFRYFLSEIIRPDNATAYAAGETVSGANDEHFVFGNSWDNDDPRFRSDDSVIRLDSPYASGRIKEILISTANQGTAFEGAVLLYSAPVAPIEDGDPFSCTAEESKFYLGRIEIVASDWQVLNAGSGAAGVQVAVVKKEIPVSMFPTESKTGQIHGYLVAGAAYTPVAEQEVTIRLGIEQD